VDSNLKEFALKVSASLKGKAEAEQKKLLTERVTGLQDKQWSNGAINEFLDEVGLHFTTASQNAKQSTENQQAVQQLIKNLKK
jgi:hypothetical protein